MTATMISRTSPAPQLTIRATPIMFSEGYRILDGQAEERITPAVVEQALRERSDVPLVVNHDPARVIARTGDGSLRLWVDSYGVQVETTIDESSREGRHVAEAFRAGAVAGGSFSFRPHLTRWRLDTTPPRVELRQATLHELTLAIAPAQPAYPNTWAVASGPLLDKLRRLDRFRVRPALDDAKPDATITVAPPRRSLLTELEAVWLGHVTYRHQLGAVRDYARRHPGVRVVDCRTPRRLRDLLAVQAFRERQVREGTR